MFCGDNWCNQEASQSLAHWNPDGEASWSPGAAASSGSPGVVESCPGVVESWPGVVESYDWQLQGVEVAGWLPVLRF